MPTTSENIEEAAKEDTSVTWKKNINTKGEFVRKDAAFRNQITGKIYFIHFKLWTPLTIQFLDNYITQLAIAN